MLSRHYVSLIKNNNHTNKVVLETISLVQIGKILKLV